MNVNRLKDFKARLVVFPKRNGAKYAKAGDASAADVAAATQFTGDLNTVPKKSAAAITVGKITDEMKDFKAFYTLRNARNEAKLQGPRDKKKREIASKE